MPILLDGVALANATAPVLFQTCRFPIMDLRRYRVPDEVVQNMETYIGGWAPGTIAPAIETQVMNIDTVTNTADACRFPIVAFNLTTCSWIAPNQKVVGLESEEINWLELVTRYCTVTNISPDRLGQIFNADGTLVVGNPYTLNLVRAAAAEVRQGVALSVTQAAMVGDESNTNQFDGLYTQIDNGWQDGSPACDDTLNVGNEINWDLLTGGDGLGNASPDAVTVAGTVTLWGQSFDIPAGWTLADFLAYFAQSAQANYGRGEEIEWEMHAPSGWRMAVLKALSCIKLCNVVDTFMTDAVLARYQRLVSGKIAELFGYGLTFPIFETYYAGANSLRFGPRALGGIPTYGLVFENIVNVLRQLNPLGQALYGSGAGQLPGDPEPLLAMTREQIVNRFEALSLHWDFLKVSATCVRPSLMVKPGLLATDRHLWVKITNVGVNTFRLDAPVDMTIDGDPFLGDQLIGLLAAPAFTAPANAAHITNGATVTLDWAVVTDADHYGVQVASDSGFSHLVLNVTNNTDTDEVTSVLPEGTYYWHTRTYDAAGLPGVWSATRTFIVDALGQAVITSPVNGSTTADTTPDIVVTAVTGADTYQFQIAYDAAFASLAQDTTQAGATFTSGVLASGSYYVRARAIDATNGPGAWSLIRRFTIS